MNGEITDETLESLRQLAEVEREEGWGWYPDWQGPLTVFAKDAKFVSAASPEVILGVLNRLKAAEEKLSSLPPATSSISLAKSLLDKLHASEQVQQPRGTHYSGHIFDLPAPEILEAGSEFEKSALDFAQVILSRHYPTADLIASVFDQGKVIHDPTFTCVVCEDLYPCDTAFEAAEFIECWRE